MVVFLHYNNKDMGGGLLFATGGTLVVFKIIESICIVAVPIFVLITGYFLYKNKSFSLRKIVGLYILLISYKLVCLLMNIFIFKYEYGLSSFISILVPSNYYINFYLVLVIISPLLNKIFNLSKKNVTVIIVLLSLLFIVFPTIVDMGLSFVNKDFITGLSFLSNNGDNRGYTIVVFIILYLLGAFIHYYDIKFKKIISLTIYLSMSSILTILSYKFSVWNYNNVFVLMSSLSLFLLFKEIHIKEIRIITILSSCSLGVFVLHTTSFFTKSFNSLFKIEENISKGLGFGIVNMLIVVLSTTLICIFIDLILRLISKPIKNELYSYSFINKKIIDLDETSSVKSSEVNEDGEENNIDSNVCK